MLRSFLSYLAPKPESFSQTQKAGSISHSHRRGSQMIRNLYNLNLPLKLIVLLRQIQSNYDDNDNLLRVNISMLQQHAHCAWATMIIKLIIFVTYGACWTCLCCHNSPNSDMDCRMRIFIVYKDVNACNCTQGCTDTERGSALWKLTLGRKPLVSAVWQSHALTNWTTSHPENTKVMDHLLNGQ